MEKYSIISVVGEGAYGIVLKAKLKDNPQNIVAIKKFKEADDDELFRKTISREIEMLKLVKHENIVGLKEIFKHKERIHLVFEYCDKTVLELLEEQPLGLDPIIIKKIMYQLTKAIEFCHRNNVIHRDIKPENLLVNNDNSLKLCDFGFARKLSFDYNIKCMTDYVATR